MKPKTLPPKFTTAEQEAYQWLHDTNTRPWLVDLLTKQVITPNTTYESLIAYRKHIENKTH